MSHPTLKTYQEFITNYQHDTEEEKLCMYKQYVFAQKESLRKKKQYQRRKEKRNAILETLPESQRPKVGRPRKKTVEDYKKELEEMKLQLDTVKRQLEEKTKETFPQPPQLPDPVPVPEPEPVPVPEPEPEPVPEPKREPKNFVKFNPNLPLYATSSSIQSFGNLISNTKVKRCLKKVS